MFYKLVCEVCGWKKIFEDEDDSLHELKSSPIPVNVKKWNEKKGVDVKVESKKQPKKFRCQGCGRVVIPKKIKDAQKELEKKNSEIERQKLIEEDKIKLKQQFEKEIEEKRCKLKEDKSKK